MGSLKGRIALLKERGSFGSAKVAPSGENCERIDANPRSLPGWTKIGKYLLTREYPCPLLAPQPWRAYKRLKEEGQTFAPSSDSALFFDFETTGLSGGAGTIAFLAAFGRFEGSDFTVTQFLLTDFPGEKDFLAAIAGILAERPALVTYNGSSFDIPLLRARCIMNGIPMPTFDHLDLLHDSRRLWSSVYGDCSLQGMERAILGFERVGDIPGALIPAIWHDFSTSGGFPGRGAIEEMVKVASHNVMDVENLARLFIRVVSILDDPSGASSNTRFDQFRLACGLRKAGRMEEAHLLLEEAGYSGDQRALRRLAIDSRRAGRMDECAKIVDSMDGTSLDGCIEKSKLWEHFRKNPAVALEFACRARNLPGLGKTTELRLSRRIRRLERKIGELRGREDSGV